MPRLKRALLSPKLFVKSILLFTIVYTIYLSTSTTTSVYLSTTQSKLNIYTNQLYQKINLQFNQWYYNILVYDYNLFSDSNFQQQLTIIKSEKLQDENHKIDLGISTIVLIYPYHTDKKPLIQPFDPRLTLSVYYNYIETNKDNGNDLKLPFHWSDWVDFSKLHNLFDISNNDKLNKDSEIKSVDQYCQFIGNANNGNENKATNMLGYKIFAPAQAQTGANHELIGKSYLYTQAPSPKRLIFLTNTNGNYQFDVDNYNVNNISNSILYNEKLTSNLASKVNKENEQSSTLNVLSSYISLIKNSPPSLLPTKQQNNPKDNEIDSHIIEIPEEYFINDPQSIINQLESSNSQLSNSEKDFLSSIKYSVDCKDPPKYFYEAKYQSIILHRLLKNYLKFTQSNNLITWIAHGSLLSWYWNGINFPWDTDIDVQMPIHELYQLARFYNQSLVVENAGTKRLGNSDKTEEFEFDGMGRYFIDVGSSVTHRTKGNGNNNIDARFIDIDTGLYIDITGLALTNEESPDRYNDFLTIDQNTDAGKQKFDQLKQNQKDGDKNNNYSLKNQQLKLYNCRNNHFSSYNELSPLIQTVVENQPGYIPKNFILIKFNKLSKSDHINLLKYNPIMMKEYLETMNFTNYHNLELSQLLKISNYNHNHNNAQTNVSNIGIYRESYDLFNHYRNNYKLGYSLRPDHFINFIIHDNSRWDYQLQVDDLIKLQKQLENDSQQQQEQHHEQQQG
ncbi:LicD family protein [Candida albicans]|uniref:LicD family protein n=1 Tax=Candida albicans TaxID=5476 RepID=A0A8H6F1W7_CANAX|nr:LicD family protein [Candida albicans]